MHEYLHKYFEKIKKTGKKFFIRNMRPLTYVSPPPPAGGYGGVFPPALRTDTAHRTRQFSDVNVSQVSVATSLRRGRTSSDSVIANFSEIVTVKELFENRPVFDETVCRILGFTFLAQPGDSTVVVGLCLAELLLCGDSSGHAIRVMLL